jgi:hypothetical protein
MGESFGWENIHGRSCCVKKKWMVLKSVLVAVLFTFISDVSAAVVYAQLSNRQDQLSTMDNINQGIIVTMENVDGNQGMGFDAKKNEIIVQEDGVYYLSVVAQMGARESASGIVKGGDIYFWPELNGKAIENSGSWVFASPTARAHTIVENVILSLKKGDRIRFKFAASSPSMGLITFDATEKWPASPGLGVSIYQLH